MLGDAGPVTHVKGPGQVDDPGFRVVGARPPEFLEARGSHRFSSYSLVFGLHEREEGTLVCAETRAEFPGLRGAFYRAVVVGSRAHVLVVRRLLGVIEQRAARGPEPLGRNTP
jgi:hypothetical protein